MVLFTFILLLIVSLWRFVIGKHLTFVTDGLSS